jgi:sulfofructose kinase
MALADHLIVPLNLAAEVTGTDQPQRAAALLACPGRSCTAVTCGKRGCWFVEASDPATVRHQPAFEVRVVDTTGCGDVFHGAYAAAHVWGYTVRRAIEFATAAAALKATRAGGQAGIPDRAAVEKFLA